MKKILLGIILFLCFINVSAKDYSLMELIPVGESANVTTKSFFYHNFYYDNSREQASYLNNNTIRFEGIKNLNNEEKFISVTLGFFDEKKENIGVYYYCSNIGKNDSNYNIKLLPNESKTVMINVSNEMLYNNKVDNVKYIAIMSENPNCNSGTNYDFVGKKVQYINFEDNANYDYKYVKYCFYVLILIVVVLILKFVFDLTLNKNGRITDVIFGIAPKDKRTNEEIKNEYFKRREEENEKNKKVEDKKEIADISQEKGKTDLHNMYK